MLSKFIFSKDGFLFLDKFKNRFGCRFRCDEPSNDIVLDADEKTYKIPRDETVEHFKSLVLESIKTGKNLLCHWRCLRSCRPGADRLGSVWPEGRSPSGKSPNGQHPRH
jgi:hypothetical protein